MKKGTFGVFAIDEDKVVEGEKGPHFE